MTTNITQCIIKNFEQRQILMRYIWMMLVVRADLHSMQGPLMRRGGWHFSACVRPSLRASISSVG